MRSLVPLRHLALRAVLLTSFWISSVSAYPVAGIHWGGCPLPQNDPTNRDFDGTTHQTISVTVRGLSGVVRGTGVSVSLKAQESGIADAWRFDEAGCNDGHLAFNHLAASDLCPLLTGPNEQNVNAVRYLALIDSPSGFLFAAELFYDYRSFDAITADPDVTYTLARFDMDFGTTCDCIERKMCIMLQNHFYVDGDGAEHPITLDREYLNWNDPVNSTACPGAITCTPDCEPAGVDTTCAGATPVRAQSWGSVKASYR